MRTASLRSSSRSSAVRGAAPRRVSVMVPSGWSVEAASLRTNAISKKASMMTASMGEHEKPIGTPSVCLKMSSPTVTKMLSRMKSTSSLNRAAV